MMYSQRDLHSESANKVTYDRQSHNTGLGKIRINLNSSVYMYVVMKKLNVCYE